MPTKRGTLGTARRRTVPRRSRARWRCRRCTRTAVVVPAGCARGLGLRPCACGVPVLRLARCLHLLPQRLVRLCVGFDARAKREPPKRPVAHDAGSVHVGVALVRAPGAPKALARAARHVDVPALRARLARVEGGELQRPPAPGFEGGRRRVLGHPGALVAVHAEVTARDLGETSARVHRAAQWGGDPHWWASHPNDGPTVVYGHWIDFNGPVRRGATIGIDCGCGAPGGRLAAYRHPEGAIAAVRMDIEEAARVRAGTRSAVRGGAGR